MNSYDIQHAIYRWRHFDSKHAPLVPNFTPSKWFECDVYSVTKAGFSHEYEIKISRSDFKADFEKETRVNNPNWKRLGDKNNPLFFYHKKHDMLNESVMRPVNCPNYFWFVTPEGLLREADIPEYAGWAEVYANHWGKPAIRIKKQAPRLHKQKVSDQLRKQILEIAQYRLMTYYFDINYKMAKRLAKLEKTNDQHND